MIIKELILLSFGKFNKKKIILEDGLNIIYAKDQVEKTTIHKFIEGMFLGFIKNKDSSNYDGILKYQHNGDVYRVERRFLKEENELKIFDEQTGEELKSVFEYDSVTRLHDPSSIHLNLNRVMFSSTLNIEQRDSKNDDELEKEVKNSLMNIGDSLDGDLSVDNVIGWLKKEIEEIRTEKRTTTSPYGKVVKRIEMLEQEKEKSYTALIETNEYTMRLNKERAKLNQMIDEREDLRQVIKEYEEYERYNMFNEIKTIENEMKSLESKLETSLDYRPIPTQEYNDILRIVEKIKISKQQVQTITEKEKNLKKDIDIINNELEYLLKINLNDEIDFDLYEYESKIEELFKLKEVKSQFDDNTQKDKISNISKNIDSIKSKRVLILWVTLLSATLGVSNINLLVAPVVLIISALVLIIKEKDLKKKRTRLEQLIEKAIYSEKNLDDRIEKIDKEKCDILRRQNSRDIKELKEKKLSLERQKRLSYEKQSYIKQKKDVYKEKENLTIYYQDLKLDLEYLLENNNLRDVNHLNDMVEKRYRDKKILAKLESKRLILENLKSKLNLEKLNKEFEEFKFSTEHIEKMKKQDIDKIKQNYEKKCGNISSKKTEIKEIDNKIESLQINARNLVSIQEDINKSELEKRKYDEGLKSLNIEKYTLESVSKNIHKESSPKLNKLISDIISSVTNKEHTNIKLEEKLSIKAINNKGTLIDLACLNGENIEQLYFSVRRNIIPLILSDTFVQYDDIKLENMLKRLYKESLKRQIIVFTCKKREVNILDKLKLKYKLTKL